MHARTHSLGEVFSISIFLILLLVTVFRYAVGVHRYLGEEGTVEHWYNSLKRSSQMVAIQIYDTAYYGLDDDGLRDWAHMLPSGGHLVRLNDSSSGSASTPSPSPPKSESIYTPTLFHQLKCLELYHQEYYLSPVSKPIKPIIQHCINYLRQQILCHANTKIESVKNTGGQSSRFYTTVCRDWTGLYEKAEMNHAMGGNFP